MDVGPQRSFGRTQTQHYLQNEEKRRKRIGEWISKGAPNISASRGILEGGLAEMAVTAPGLQTGIGVIRVSDEKRVNSSIERLQSE